MYFVITSSMKSAQQNSESYITVTKLANNGKYFSLRDMLPFSFTICFFLMVYFNCRYTCNKMHMHPNYRQTASSKFFFCWKEIFVRFPLLILCNDFLFSNNLIVSKHTKFIPLPISLYVIEFVTGHFLYFSFFQCKFHAIFIRVEHQFL